MPDIGERATERIYRDVRDRVTDIYRQAYKDVSAQSADFLSRHKARAESYLKMVEEGTLTRADYEAWMRGQVFQGRQWAARLEQIQQTLYNADKTALDIVNGRRFDVFAANANYMGYSLEHELGANTGFGLYDANSVARLVRDNPDMLPPRKVGKDKAYRWYGQRVQTAITQGILQGEGVDEIAKRIGRETGESLRSSLLRNARTAYTGAQNAGRIEGLHQAQDLGIEVKKRWLATLDDRTRDTHAELDGQVRDVDEPFEVDGMEIDYPGDPSADPSLVYNCRCTLEYVYPKYDTGGGQRRDNITGELVEDMSYREWERMKHGDR